MSWQCPECNEELTSLDYNVQTNGSEYGSSSLSHNYHEKKNDIIEDHDFSDNGNTEWSDDPEYQCPECCETINPEELIWVEDDEDENESKPTKNTDLEEKSNGNVIAKYNKMYEYNMGTTENKDKILEESHICTKCSYLFPQSKEEEDNNDYKNEQVITCPNCNKQFTEKEGKKNIEQRVKKELTLIKVVSKITIRKHVKRI